MTERSIAAVVPAAGRSERFGSLKLVADVAGEPLLNRTLGALIEGGAAPVFVVLAPAAALDTVSLLRHPSVATVVNPDPSRGMFSSIQCGLERLGPGPVLVLPADMPFVGSATVALVAATSARTDRVVVPVHEGRRGHPIGVPGRLVSGLIAADPAKSLKHALAGLREEPLLVEVDDEGVVRDVDTRDDLLSTDRRPGRPQRSPGR